MILQPQEFKHFAIQLSTLAGQTKSLNDKMQTKESCWKMAMQMLTIVGSANKCCSIMHESLYRAIYISAGEVPTTPFMDAATRAKVDAIVLSSLSASTMMRAKQLDVLEGMKINMPVK